VQSSRVNAREQLHRGGDGDNNVGGFASAFRASEILGPESDRIAQLRRGIGYECYSG